MTTQNPFQDEKYINDLRRFSSELLDREGSQRTSANGTNKFKFSRGQDYGGAATPVVLGPVKTVGGSFPENVFYAVYAFFESRGNSKSQSQVMASLILDTAKEQGVHPMSLLDEIKSNKIAISTEYQAKFNALRPVGNQQFRTKKVSNRRSLQNRNIRA